MPGSQRAKRKLVEGRPALIVIDIQAGTFVEKEIRAIAHMPGYADRMARARVAIDKARARGIPVIFIQEVHRPDLVDFGRELDGSEDVHCEDCVAGSSERAHEGALEAMEYLQGGARRSIDEVLDAMAAYEEASSIRPVPSTRHREI